MAAEMSYLSSLEAEGASHAAASRSGGLEVDADAAQQRFLGGHLHDGLVMAVSVQQRLALEVRQRRIPGVEFEKFAEQEGLLAQGLGALVVREEVEQFVAEDGDAAGLESDDGDARFDLGLEFVEDIEQQGFRAVEHAEVVEWAAAAEVGLREDDVVSGGFEDFDGGSGGRGQEVVVERVGPEENGRPSGAEARLFWSA